jgi:hypothetical protein
VQDAGNLPEDMAGQIALDAAAVNKLYNKVSNAVFSAA